MDYDSWIEVEGRLVRPLKKEEFDNYYDEFKKGDLTAREKLINHNIRLVVNCVNNKFSNYYDKKELFSAGLIGLIKSVDTFDNSKKINFSTYAYKCIYNSIIMSIRRNEKFSKCTSLDFTVNEDSDGHELALKDILEDETNLADDFENKEVFLKIREYFETLEGTSREIIKLCFGFDCDVHTQAQICKIIGKSRSLVSKVYVREMKKIKLMLIEEGLIEEKKLIKTK